jgi:nucleoid-associated protein YgaU
MKLSRLFKKYFKSTEEVVSMFLGLVIMIVVVGLLFNFIQKRKGSVTIPGISDISISKEDLANQPEEDNLESNYVVVENDTLWKIAETKYNDGFAWKEIAKANNIENPNKLEVGKKLVIPNRENKELAISNENTNSNTNTTITAGEYKVMKGDSLWKIAVRAYGDGFQWTKIWQENKSKLIDPNELEIGMTLIVPDLKL